jgi:hypothetical protein
MIGAMSLFPEATTLQRSTLAENVRPAIPIIHHLVITSSILWNRIVA